jgi:hypothetical protein
MSAGSRLRRQGPAALAGALMLIGALLILVAVVLPDTRPVALSSGSPGASTAASAPAATGTVPPSPTASPTPEVTASPTPQPTPQPTPRVIAETGIDLTWRPVARLTGGAADPSTQTVTVASIAKGPAGYVAVGTVVDGSVGELGATGPVHPGIWVSPDGLTWKQGNVAALGDRSPVQVVANGSAYLIVAYQAADRVVLRSTDASTWTDVTPAGAQVARVLVGGPGFIASGWLDPGGAAAVWSSANGSTWSSVYTESTATTALVGGSVAADGRILLVGQVASGVGTPTAAALVSPDGVHWTRAREADLPTSMTFDAVGVGADGAWYGAGFDSSEGGIGIWRSTDGLTWTPTGFGDAQRTELPGDTGSARSVFAYAGSTWVLAYTSCCGDPPQRTLRSRDGATWERVERGTAVTGAHLTDLLPDGQRLLAVGMRDVGGYVWLATAPPTNGVEFVAELSPMPASAVCSGTTTYRVQLRADRSGPTVRIFVVQLGTPAFPQGFPQIIWPNGWTAAAGPPLTIRDASGTVVLTEGDTLTLTGGRLDVAYHLCQLNGSSVAGG